MRRFAQPFLPMFFYCSSLSMLTVQIKVAMKTQVSGRVQLNPMMFKSIWFQRVPKAQLWFTMVHISFELHQPFFLQTFVGARPSSSRGSISWWTTGRHRQGASALVAFWICSCICFVAAPPTQPTSSRSAYCICLVSGLAAFVQQFVINHDWSSNLSRQPLHTSNGKLVKVFELRMLPAPPNHGLAERLWMRLLDLKGLFWYVNKI